MKALILAGGLGTRLRPLTFTRPKHLLPIANRPHIEHVFDLLANSDVTEIALLTSYLAAAFDEAVAKAAERGLAVEVADEKEPLGTAGALKNAEDLAGNGTFLVFNGDILTDTDLNELVAWHHATGSQATIALTPVEDPSAFGVVPTDAHGKVEGFIEKPPRDEAPTNLINAGIYVMEPSVLESIPPGRVWSAERQLFPALVTAGVMFARPVEGYWMDIGTPAKYLQANLDALAGAYRTGSVDGVTGAGVLAAEGALVAGDATVSQTCLGAGAGVGAGARVTESVLLPGAQIGAGAIVERCVLGENAVITPGTRLGGRALGDRETV